MVNRTSVTRRTFQNLLCHGFILQDSSRAWLPVKKDPQMVRAVLLQALAEGPVHPFHAQKIVHRDKSRMVGMALGTSTFVSWVLGM